MNELQLQAQLDKGIMQVEFYTDKIANLRASVPYGVISFDIHENMKSLSYWTGYVSALKELKGETIK